MTGALYPADLLGTLEHALTLAEGRGAPARALASLRSWVALLRAAPPARWPVLVEALRTMHPRAELPASGHTGPLSAAYPCASRKVQARLVLGESPAQITGLTRAEAHEYLVTLAETHATPARWLLRRGVWFAERLPVVRSVPVARWILAVSRDTARWDALTRERVVRGPHGEEETVRYLDRTDELLDRDLRPSVEETFRFAASRMARETERVLRRKHAALAAPPAWWRPARCARLLLTGAELAVEGREMRHCVATYAGYVRRGSSVIVALAVPERQASGEVVVRRSTVELTRGCPGVVQHRGVSNREPPAVCDRALGVLLRRWRA